MHFVSSSYSKKVTMMGKVIAPKPQNNMSTHSREHWAAVKWILRYLKGTSGVCLRYGVGKPVLEGFTDSDMSGDVDSS